MTIRANVAVMEPSAEAVQATRERLRALGFLLTDDATRDLYAPSSASNGRGSTSAPARRPRPACTALRTRRVRRS